MQRIIINESSNNIKPTTKISRRNRNLVVRVNIISINVILQNGPKKMK